MVKGFREFLNERQEIKKVSLNFKEVKSSISDYKFFVARMGFNIEFIARKDYCYTKMKENDRSEKCDKVIREKEVKGFAQAKKQCEKWAVELYNEGLVIY